MTQAGEATQTGEAVFVDCCGAGVKGLKFDRYYTPFPGHAVAVVKWKPQVTRGQYLFDTTTAAALYEILGDPVKDTVKVHAWADTFASVKWTLVLRMLD